MGKSNIWEGVDRSLLSLDDQQIAETDPCVGNVTGKKGEDLRKVLTSNGKKKVYATEDIEKIAPSEFLPLEEMVGDIVFDDVGNEFDGLDEHGESDNQPEFQYIDMDGAASIRTRDQLLPELLDELDS